MGLVANYVEAQGISTLSIGTVRDIMARVRAPRGVFINHPVCRTFGRPRARRRHQQILAHALRCALLFKERGQIVDLPYQWKDRPGSSWEEVIQRDTLKPKAQHLPWTKQGAFK